MSEKKGKELKVSEKKELASPAELTKPGLVFTPDVDIFETETEITLLADIPGVRSEDLTVDLREDTLTLIGEVADSIGEDKDAIYSEYRTGRYYRQFSLSEVIDQEKIDARLADGVLRLSLPKVEKATPRQIAVQAG
jgi:HSP20 family molecular chaperone IbpA